MGPSVAAMLSDNGTNGYLAKVYDPRVRHAHFTFRQLVQFS